MTAARCVIVVPVYNESQSLPVFIAQLVECQVDEVEFVLVDNGSTDADCSRLLAVGGAQWSSIRIEANCGFGGAVVEAARQLDAEHVGWMPANLKVHPREAVKLARIAAQSPHAFVKASRRGRSVLANLKTVLAGIAQSLVARTVMLDTGGTPTICERTFLLSLPNPPQSVVFESYVLFMATRLGLEVKRPSVLYGERQYGSSHWQRGLRSEFRLLRDILVQVPRWSADVQRRR
jgi:glycosyltransferase involved in cell wall biosynthesis